jgi:transposase-like protein
MKLARLLVKEVIEEEALEKAGERHSRDKPMNGRFSRWGTNPGSVRIGQEKVPIEVQRLMDNQTGETFSPESYQAMRELPAPDQQLQEAVLLGLSQGNYGRVISRMTDGFGLSQSSVSRRFQKRAAQALKEFEERSLEEDDFVALWIDGKHLAGRQMVVCLGLTEGGEKKALGFVEATTEAAGPIKELFRDLIERGLCIQEGLLCIVDGGKGLHKAVREVFGAFAELQRCQWHKRENVVSYLNDSDGKTYKRKLRDAYRKPTYEAAKAALMQVHTELQSINRSAARSLQEGLEETLTLHRLGVYEELGRSLKTTNCIESLNSRIEQHTGKVKRWHHSEQRQQWTALSLMEAERGMRRISGYKHLPKLRKALQETVPT